MTRFIRPVRHFQPGADRLIKSGSSADFYNTDPILFFCRRRTQTDTDSYLKAEYGMNAKNMP